MFNVLAISFGQFPFYFRSYDVMVRSMRDVKYIKLFCFRLLTTSSVAVRDMDTVLLFAI